MNNSGSGLITSTQEAEADLVHKDSFRTVRAVLYKETLSPTTQINKQHGTFICFIQNVTESTQFFFVVVSGIRIRAVYMARPVFHH